MHTVTHTQPCTLTCMHACMHAHRSRSSSPGSPQGGARAAIWPPAVRSCTRYATLRTGRWTSPGVRESLGSIQQNEDCTHTHTHTHTCTHACTHARKGCWAPVCASRLSRVHISHSPLPPACPQADVIARFGSNASYELPRDFFDDFVTVGGVAAQPSRTVNHKPRQAFSRFYRVGWDEVQG